MFEGITEHYERSTRVYLPGRYPEFSHHFSSDPKPQKDAPRTSAQPVQDSKRKNLTLYDWMNVFAFPGCHHSSFQNLHTGALVFSQETLSRKLKMCSKLEARVNSNPTALSSKREHTVTRPDVERGLVLWVQQMEGKGETVTGDMLIEKRRRLENAFNVPEYCWLGTDSTG
ncbi:hypothetical protein B0H14DRAFT_2346770 [Mycena olivaceomarginata]|nr:hypothetical protein B0H14DRAFT_2346770 [Mycena olivaceomarginata]